ncbi:hypothetical protein SDRG_11173 [Saprolegnia diclina VS20]|uniref:SGNH domain-containing protein n=1 Tax=Saprolegnia diclina (strain VS20) TaxID=1156394 RepID=T0RMQ4_SAPDV|nr:hypothetical protein SDRG_11173 [Saprolegnia diclina VS20]EQC31252.1 hypothetical protein SDRG_11173 [Saprolegnia diclina VS20]|eukprot:XP_008615425.1 hypothetical protein SDRG_11173 [Saprolegnia diclina VS20]
MRLSYRKAIALQLAVVVVSFGINVSLLGVQGSNKWSFYMPLSRFWQMALGGLLAYLHCTAIVEVEVEVEPEVEPETETEPSVLEHAVQRVAAMYVAAAPSSRDQVVSIVGLGLVLVGFASVNEDRLFPGFWALLPTLGATLLIAAGPDAAFNKHVLGHPLLVYIGKISYCLYLWHWPLLVFAIERYPDASSRPAYMAPWVMLGISLLLSVLTYEDVEKRLRRRTSKLVTPLLVLCVMALGVLAALAYASPTHYSAIELDLAASMDSDFASTADMSVVATTAPAGVIQDVVPTATLAAVVAQVNASTAAAALNASTDLAHSTVAPVAAAEIKATVAPTPAVPKNFAKTTVKMARHAIADGEWDKPIPGYCPTDTPYITTAKLREPFPFKDPTYAGYPERCQAINPRHEANGVIVVLGDSHGDMSKPRFAQLFNESIAAKQPFPTVVFKTRWGRAMLPCRPEFAQNIEMLKTLKPNVALFVVHWVQYLNPGAPKNKPASHPPVCCMYEGAPCKEQSLADVDAILAEFQSQLLAVSALGIKVFVVDQSPEYARINPNAWIQGDKVKLPAPVSRATFQKEKTWLFERLHPTFTAANATVIDYADDYSDGDTLKLTDAYGEPTMCFGGHLSTYTARKHLHVLDRVVQAALVV